jgi:7,8-dihydropterin-6-yl-methyl-4-(beta-D-ribofuranosyl)aminobenzene 5'-phosphate synthase
VPHYRCYVDIADKGIVTVTGCGHPGIMNLLGFTKAGHIEA